MPKFISRFRFLQFMEDEIADILMNMCYHHSYGEIKINFSQCDFFQETFMSR